MENTVKITAITSELVGEAFTDAFRRQVGLGKAYRRADLAEATGMDISTINGLMDGKGTPSLWKLLRICAVLGPDFTNEVLAIAGQGRAQALRPEEICIYEINRAAGDYVSQFARHLANDGRICPAEEAEQVPAIEALHRVTGDFLARRRRASVRAMKGGR